MTIYDITLPMKPGMPTWPGDPAFEIDRVESMDAGAHVNVSRLTCSVHTGTHVDAPHHFLNDGRTVDGLLLDILIGDVFVCEIPPDVSLITASVLEMAAIPGGITRLLLKTRNSGLWLSAEGTFQEDFVAIAPDGAEWLTGHEVRLIGLDYLSIAPFKGSDETHLILLREGVVILEGVNLSGIQAGKYRMYCLPLNLVGSDGAPARVVLIR